MCETTHIFMCSVLSTCTSNVRLEELGSVRIIKHPEKELQPLYRDCQNRGEEFLFVCFTPPHLAPLDIDCPTICLFAWEFSTIPTESWDQNPANSWTHVFANHVAVIATSTHTANVVSKATNKQGWSIPTLGIPSPVWDDFAALRLTDPLSHLQTGSQLAIRGTVQDTNSIDFDLSNLLPRHFYNQQHFTAENLVSLTPKSSLAKRLDKAKLHWRNFLAEVSGSDKTSTTSKTEVAEVQPETSINLNGIVYTTILNPEDGRKCHLDLMTAFVSAFKDDADATLLMKMTQSDADSYKAAINHTLHQLYPYKCRIVVFNEYLSLEEYHELISASTYYINTSYCEGLCLPLMEFLSSGKPVIAPLHTAMEDYITESVAFVTESTVETNVWPHDPRGHYTTERHRNNWESIVEQLRKSFDVAKQDTGTYRRMSEAAKITMEEFCSFQAVKTRMADFFEKLDTSASDEVNR